MTQSWQEHAHETLRRAGTRAGGARNAVVDVLGAQECCASAQEIFDRLRGDGRRVGLATVYRTLDQLVSLALAQRVDVGDGVARYEPAHPGGEHHHHLVCAGCGRVVAFEDPPLEEALSRVGERLGYAVDAHDVVLHGACGDCRDGG